jgi:hypothetical protein
MWLIKTKTLELEEFLSQAPSYAILSHTWGKEEVTFVDWQYNLPEARKKLGFSKIQKSCEQALKEGHGYLWCDTNCIDKRSSAELSEAINSMFKWYKNSAICYAYLADVSPGDMSSFSSSRWFTRGWTLQELLAPKALTFYANDWSEFGSRSALSQEIFDITKIKKDCMGDYIYQASISERMSWVSNRETSRPEDIAYCMLGIFDINMPLLYGEGKKAFIRLQEEIIRVSNDQSIFCWHWDPDHVPRDWLSMLSPSPKTFIDSGYYHRASGADDSLPYHIGNSGLSISLKVLDIVCAKNGWVATHQSRQGPKSTHLLALLDVSYQKNDPYRGECYMLAIALIRTSRSNRFSRFPFPPRPLQMDDCGDVKPTEIYISGPRDLRHGKLPPKEPTQHNGFETVLVVTSPYQVEYIKERPSVRESLRLQSLTSTYFGAVFAVTLTIKPRMESITIFCFIGVDEHNYREWRYCEILEAWAPTSPSSDIDKTVSALQARIIQTVLSSPSSGRRSLPKGAKLIDRLKISEGKEFQMHTGPWNRVSGDKRMSVTHITIPMLPSFRFHYKQKGGLLD